MDAPRLRTRCTAISLARRPDRWAASEEHLRSVLPDDVPLDIFPGSDAKAAIAGTVQGEARIAALEAALDCQVYRGWPVTETDDVRRCFPNLASASEAEAWIGYQRACAACFRPDRARLYHDFFMRHLAVGEMGASVSHLRVIERAHAEQLELQIVFEDDARPTADAVPLLLEEVDRLAAANVDWALIYLHSANYGRRAESRIDGPPESQLRHAGHRRVTHAYALSRSGIGRIATCGYRSTLFPFDDFLSSLHAGHPRPDVMALECVRVARGKADGTADMASFVGLTFPDEPPLCVVPERCGSEAALESLTLDSDSKVGHGSAVLLGDSGVEHSNHTEGAPSVASPTGKQSAPASVSADRLPCAPLLWSDLENFGRDPTRVADAVHAQMAAHGFMRVRVGAAEMATLVGAEAASASFFARGKAEKAAQVGKGGRLGELMLWSCGYSSWPQLREQWHVVCGAPDAQPWPAATSSSEALRDPLMRAEALLRRIAVRSLAAIASLAEGEVALLAEACDAMGAGSDPSVLDAFHYLPDEAAAAPSDAALAMAEHHDPGVLTLTRVSDVPGLQLLDPSTGVWVALEELAAADEVLIFAGEQLERASAGRLRSAPHRVARPPPARRGEARQSVVFELRAPGVL